MKKIITGSVGVSGPQPGVRRKLGTATGFLTAAVLCLATIAGPNLAHAAHGGGGGGFHGGGSGGFHGGGFGASVVAGLVASTPADLVGSADFTVADFPAVALTRMHL
jgi:hypothetical protein